MGKSKVRQDYLWVCRNAKNDRVCMTSAKPKYRKIGDPIWSDNPGGKEFLFEGKYFNSVNHEVFEALTGLSVEEEQLMKVPISYLRLAMKC